MCGLAKSSSNEPKVSASTNPKISDMDGIEMIVDSPRRGTLITMNLFLTLKSLKKMTISLMSSIII